jgi:hypothetical protein
VVQRFPQWKGLNARRKREVRNLAVSLASDKSATRKLAHNPVAEGLAFLFAFQIESFPVAAGALGSPAGRLLDVQLSAEAHG